MLKIISLEVGSLGANCHITYCDNTLECAIIDPGGNAADILALIRKNKLKVTHIINTHGHADHIMANTVVRETVNAPLCIHEADAAMLTSAQLNLSVFFGEAWTCQPADCLLTDGDTIQVGEIAFTVLHTPGHTPGGICLVAENTLFSGDTLFAESVGRTDFPGGSFSQLFHSITQKLFTLDGATKVLPGHGASTTIEWEKNNNPYVTESLFD